MFRQSDDGRNEILRNLLSVYKFNPKDIIEYDQNGQTTLAIYFKDFDKAHCLSRSVKQLRLKGVQIREKTLQTKHWQTKWKEQFKPFAITENFTIIPIWQKKSYHPRKRKPIYIEANFAFGSGMHATTMFMAQFIDQCSGRSHSIFAHVRFSRSFYIG